MSKNTADVPEELSVIVLTQTHKEKPPLADDNWQPAPDIPGCDGGLMGNGENWKSTNKNRPVPVLFRDVKYTCCTVGLTHQDFRLL